MQTGLYHEKKVASRAGVTALVAASLLAPSNAPAVKTAKVAVTMDGIRARRTDPMPADKAANLARLFDANPRFLQAWTQDVPNSKTKQYVLWIPASGKGQETMEQQFLDGEIAKAMKEKDGYIWNRPQNWPDGVYRVITLSHRAYKISATCCECERFKAAGICKHILAGFIDEMLTVEPEAEPDLVTVPEPAIVRAPITPSQFAADWGI